jgi:succinate-acetate transporter protein
VQRPRRQAHLQSPDAMDHLRWNPVHGVSSIVALAITCGGFIRIIVSVWSTCRAQC